MVRQESTSSAQTRVATPPPLTPQNEDADAELPKTPPPIEETLAARRARRQAILAKYASKENSATPSSEPSSAVQPPSALSSISDSVSQSHSAVDTPPASAIEFKSNGLSSALLHRVVILPLIVWLFSGKRESLSATPAPAGFDLFKDGDEDAQSKVQAQGGTVEQISAADYDPSLDRREDEEKRVRAVADQSQNEIEMIEEEEEEEEEDEVDDMFAVVTSEKKKVKKVKKVVVCRCPNP